jgi:hypothetical protein
VARQQDGKRYHGKKPSPPTQQHRQQGIVAATPMLPAQGAPDNEEDATNPFYRLPDVMPKGSTATTTAAIAAQATSKVTTQALPTAASPNAVLC